MVMSDHNSTSNKLQYHNVWPLSTRLFHWINVITILGLIAVGTAILNSKTLGITGDAKILLKTIHVYIGYVFASNLIWRLIGGFRSNKFSRWTAITPFHKGYWTSLTTYIAAARAGKPQTYLGHNPVAKLMVTALFIILTTQAVTGLVLAGTDVYMPPFGNNIKQWVAEKDASGNAVMIKAGSKKGVDKEAYADMRAFRKPFIGTHYTTFYILLAAVFLHILFVIIAEIKERNGLISAMFTGKKVISKEPEDID